MDENAIYNHVWVSVYYISINWTIDLDIFSKLIKNVIQSKFGCPFSLSYKVDKLLCWIAGTIAAFLFASISP